MFAYSYCFTYADPILIIHHVSFWPKDRTLTSDSSPDWSKTGSISNEGQLYCFLISIIGVLTSDAVYCHTQDTT